jgi:hypothetical protein
MINGFTGCGCNSCKGCTRDCVHNTEVESGCCHKDDTLLLWCERPGWSYKKATSCYALVNGNNQLQETCCTVAHATEAPIQAIYHYHDCYWRCIKMPFEGVTGIEAPSEMCPSGGCELVSPCDQYYDPTCTGPNCGAFQAGCCSDTYNQNCVDCCAACSDEGMSEWRRRRMASVDQWKWVVEGTCHKQGSALGSGVDCDCLSSTGNTWCNCDRLLAIARDNQMVAVVHYERWWRLAECSGAQIVVPGCTQSEAGVNCGGNLYQTDDLVPKWWIYACSGIPLYIGDIIDAVRFGVIDSTEASEFLDDLFAPCTHPSQVILKKLAAAGYLVGKDWRAEQRQAFIELDAQFPGAGYAACIQPAASMDTLGPFRKRMTYKTPGVSNRPLLDPADVVATFPDLTYLQAGCSIDFPGGTQPQYDYWCERQWVYFRGRPGGWQWVGYQAQLSCPSETEETSILLGNGRQDPTCVGALQGSGVSPATNTACACCNSGTVGGVPVVCKGCDQLDCAAPLPTCGGGNPPDVCEIFSSSASCDGIQFRYTVYNADMFMKASNGLPCSPAGPECSQCYEIKCLYSQQSFLIEARRSRDSWLDAEPYTCRDETPPLGVANPWPDWLLTHPAPQNGLCDMYLNPSSDVSSWCSCNSCSPCPQSEYSNRACCGALCKDYACDCDPTAVNPYTGIGNTCAQQDDCPPHNTAGQLACIGYSPTCT